MVGCDYENIHDQKRQAGKSQCAREGDDVGETDVFPPSLEHVQGGEYGHFDGKDHEKTVPHGRVIGGWHAEIESHQVGAQVGDCEKHQVHKRYRYEPDRLGETREVI